MFGMMEIIILLGAVTFIVILIAVGLFAMKARKVDLTTPTSPDEKPDWMKTMPPKETTDATLAEGEGITLYNYDEGEHVAAPFAEQIEDILKAELKKDPDLAAIDVDLGTTESGDLAFWVDGTQYDRVEDIPNEGLRTAVTKAVEKWNTYMSSQDQSS